jgi:transcriptional regulator with XRE-family HTH domain
MATTLAPVDSREVVRCDHCHLVQFRTNNNLCRRCKTSLDDEPEPVVVQPAPQPVVAEPSASHLPVALAIRNLRLRAGLSQRQLAQRMKVPRTYVSKIENEKACPTLSSLERLAEALRVRVPDLLNPNGRTIEDDIRELMADEFTAQMIPFVGSLSPIQRASIVNEVREMTLGTRRSA